jgi:hypothetical protein
MSEDLEQVEHSVEPEAQQALEQHEAQIGDLEPEEHDAAKVAGGMIRPLA